MNQIAKAFLDYNHWANQKFIEQFRQLPAPNPRALRYFAHILMAEKGWMVRLKGLSTDGFDFWPNLSVEECATLSVENQAKYHAFLSDLLEADLERQATYRNSKGIEFCTSFRDILLHVAFHGAYHRGQIATAIREGGETPAYTDYIGFEREMGSPFSTTN